MPEHCKSEAEVLLLVEGVNDCHAVFQLMRLIYSVDPVFGIHACGNDDGVLSRLSAKVISSVPPKILGLILDSDIDGVGPDQVVQSRLDQLKYRIGKFYPLPDAFPEGGLILRPLPDRPDAARLPKLGVWLMPDNRAYGMFEDLLAESLPAKQRTYTAEVVNKAMVEGIATFKEAHLAKAIIRTYMAWQDPPDIQYLGLAIQRGTFENIESTCKQFIRWLEELFGAPSVT